MNPAGIIIWMIVILIYGIVCMIISRNIVKKKGYQGASAGVFGAAGFLFGLLGVLLAFLAHDLNEEKRMEEYRQQQRDSLNRQNQISDMDELLKYKQLLDSGAITQQEFDRKKYELMNR